MGKKERREWLTRITRPCFVLEFHRCDVCADLHVLQEEVFFGRCRRENWDGRR